MIIFILYSRRIASLEKDIRHAYAEMKSLMQAEEKVKNYCLNYIFYQVFFLLG